MPAAANTDKPPRKRRPPKEDQEASKGEDKKKCLVMSPFGGFFDDYHLDIYCPAIEAANLFPMRADDLFRSSNIVEDVWSMILSSEVLLADLTGRNPNVFYELGLAHAARKPVVLITRETDDVPFDLRALRYLSYEPLRPGWDRDLQDKITKSLKETLEAPEDYMLPTFLRSTAGSSPSVPEDELRFLRLEQEVTSLQAQLRSLRLTPGGTLTAGATEPPGPTAASAMIAELVAAGKSDALIVEEMAAHRIAPRWTRREIDRRRVMTDE